VGSKRSRANGRNEPSLPQSLEALHAAFTGLPSIGPRAAERLTFHILGADRAEAFAVAAALEAISKGLESCSVCGNIGPAERCAVCRDDARDRSLLLVVETIDVLALFEKTHSYRGLYHVLGPVPKKKKAEIPGIDRLVERIEKGSFREVVLALNTRPAGDAAAAEIADRLSATDVAVTRIGQGVVQGGSFGAATSKAVAESIRTRVEEKPVEAPAQKGSPGAAIRRSVRPGIPAVIDAAAEALKRLPGIGANAAGRIAFHLAASSVDDGDDKARAAELASALRAVKTKLGKCSRCGGVGDTDPCEICSDGTRDASLLCVVATPQDSLRIESTGVFKGRYHVLGGLFSPLEGVGAGDIDTKGLERRLKEGGIDEVIIATDPTFAGDGTALMVQDALKNYDVRITRIGSGVLRGGDLRFASTLQLENALASRKGIRDKGYGIRDKGRGEEEKKGRGEE